MFKLLIVFIKTFFCRVLPGKHSIKGSSNGLIIGSIIYFLFFFIDSLNFTNDYRLFIVFLLLALAIVLSALLANFTILKISSVPNNYKISFLISLIIFTSAFSFYSYKYIVISLYLIVCLSFIGSFIYKFYKRRKLNISNSEKVFSSVFLIFGLFGLIYGAILFNRTGVNFKVNVYPDFKKNNNIKHINFPNPAQSGEFIVKTLTYGSGEDRHREEFGKKADIITNSVSGNSFVSNWKGIGGWFRTSYWGFDVNELPLNARVLYPEGKGPFPLVIIVHGNHEMLDYSDKGYSYLGNLLASKGYIFVSVDENFINSTWSDIFGKLKKENDCRAWLLLEHIKLWHRWNKDTSNIFYNKIDINNIALIGHSRGGEAIVHAACFNKLPYYPDNAAKKFFYNFNIKSIVSIAPTDGQYKPSNVKTNIKNIDYFVIHGANDGDVSSFSGANQYERITFTDSLYHFKSGLYIYGANHGQFNTSWGSYDKSGLSRKFLNLNQLINDSSQRKIAKVYISAFLDVTLKNKKEYLPLFLNSEYGRKWLPQTVYLNQFENSECKLICNYDEDLDLSTTTVLGGTIQSSNLTLWKERLVKQKWGNKQSKVVCIGWNKNKKQYTAKYEIEIIPGNNEIDSLGALIFSLAAENITNMENNEKDSICINKNDSLINFTVELIDKKGEKVSFLLSEYSYLHPRLKSNIMKLSFLNKAATSENVFQTFLFPFKRMLQKNRNFDPIELKNIKFIFNINPKGKILIDNIGFMKKSFN